MFDPLPLPEEMARWDKAAIEEYGFDPHVLMENASREACRVLEELTGGVCGKRVLLLAGPGNNGGDAIALARHLMEVGARPLLALTRPRSKYQGSAGYNLRLAARLCVPTLPVSRFKPQDHAPFDVIVDGLLGTGFSGILRPDMAALVDMVNALGKDRFVLALDIPSGLSGLSGLPCPVAVVADATVTFEEAKLGPALPVAGPYTGRLIVRRIGIPGAVKAKYPATHALITDDILNGLPAPDPFLHKGRAGRVLIIGGSPGLTGAPHLAGLAALRAGAGLVTAACPAALESRVKANCPDLMTLPLSNGEDWSPDMADELAGAIARADALAIGPGLGRRETTAAFLRRLLPAPIPTVIDADALYFLAKDPELRASCGPASALTPHPGEMAVLLGLTVEEIEADRFGAARRLARETGAATVLKGPGTIIASPPETDARTFLSPISCPNLAVGGSGDVLTGLVAALMAAGNSPLQACRLGVYWHGLAGKRLAKRYPRRGNLASEIAGTLPLVIKERMHA